MLPKENRLKKKEDFDRVQTRGRFFAFENISVKAVNNKKKVTRVGFSIGVKFSKSATERNKIKRKLREIFRERISNIKPGWDIIVFAKPKGNIKKLKEITEKALKEGNLLSF